MDKIEKDKVITPHPPHDLGFLHTVIHKGIVAIVVMLPSPIWERVLRYLDVGGSTIMPLNRGICLSIPLPFGLHLGGGGGGLGSNNELWVLIITSYYCCQEYKLCTLILTIFLPEQKNLTLILLTR